MTDKAGNLMCPIDHSDYSKCEEAKVSKDRLKGCLARHIVPFGSMHAIHPEQCSSTTRPMGCPLFIFTFRTAARDDQSQTNHLSLEP